MAKKKLLSPRGYISWSQIQIFENNPKKYIEKYIYGKENDIENDYMKLGKKISTALETGEKTGDLVTDLVIEQIPKLKYREYEMKEKFDSPYGEITLLGKLDTFEPIRFDEYKTGHIKWTQKKAEEHGQMIQYATLIWLKYKKIPKDVYLDWIPTERESDGEVRVTGEPVQRFKVEITMQKILEYMARVTKVAVEIDKIYRIELGL